MLAEVMDALTLAHTRAVASRVGGHEPSVRTKHCIFFSTRLVGALMSIDYYEGQTFAQLRHKQPRRFHELLGLHIGDFVLKDRIYSLPQFRGLPPAYCLQAIIQDSTLTAEGLKRNADDVLGALAEYGEPLLCSSNATYVEAIASKFWDGGIDVEGELSFETIARLREGGTVTAALTDELLFASGRITALETTSSEEGKSDRDSPFLYVSIRGRSDYRNRHLNTVRRALAALI